MDHETALAAAAEDYRQYLDARENLRAAIRAAHDAGVRQVDILKATGHIWTREQIRRICLPK